jgi:hypothetical protein
MAPIGCPDTVLVAPAPVTVSGSYRGVSMTIDELLDLRRRQRRRLAESQPFSPEWDAAMAAVEDFDEAVRTWEAQSGDTETPRSQSTDDRSCRENV